MKLKSVVVAGSVFVAIAAANSALAHPGHEPEDLIHALAHELASPRGIVALLVLGVGAVLWLAYKSGPKK